MTTLGQSLPVVGSGQPFEPTVQNANALLLENTLLTARTNIQILQGQLRAPADLNALAALTGMTQGQLALVQEGGAFFEYNGTAWVQQSAATFASAAARTTAYAKASGAYLVQGAQTLITGVLYPYFYSVADTKWKGGQLGGGLYQVKPVIAGGSGATVGADGLVTFAAVPNPGAAVLTLPVDDFDNFMVRGTMWGSGVSQTLYLQLAVGAAPDAGANYYYAGMAASAAPASSVHSGGGTSQFALGQVGSSVSAAMRLAMDLFDFGSATRQSGVDYSGGGNNGSTAYTVKPSGFYNAQKRHDGVSFLNGAGTTMGGSLRFYGYNNG